VASPSHKGLITDTGAAVGGTFDGGPATGMMPVAHRVAGVLLRLCMLALPQWR
jgi:hypothetical protein